MAEFEQSAERLPRQAFLPALARRRPCIEGGVKTHFSIRAAMPILTSGVHLSSYNSEPAITPQLTFGPKPVRIDDDRDELSRADCSKSRTAFEQSNNVVLLRLLAELGLRDVGQFARLNQLLEEQEPRLLHPAWEPLCPSTRCTCL